MAAITLRASALTAEAFAPFGDVIETAGRNSRWINEGTCQRFDDLAPVDVLAAGGRPLISIFKGFVSERMFARWRPDGTVIRGASDDILDQVRAAITCTFRR